MKYVNGKAEGVKIAYIGGGSRGWAWKFMSDLAVCDDISGSVYLYDIDFEAAMHNEIIGNKFNSAEGTLAKWDYFAAKTPKEALTGADFVIISILPGTFDEMESDVHTPEKYGIYQPVGDTSGPGGLIRAMRTVPMYEEIAEYIKEYAPDAWVINYTNPMTLCVKTLYRVFPKIKAFGCCHEVFGTQELIASIYNEKYDTKLSRNDIDVNIVGINHFTWVNKASYKGADLMPLIREYAKAHQDGCSTEDKNWMNRAFKTNQAVKFNLLLRYGILGAAGDRHLVEFCPGNWSLNNPDRLWDRWKTKLTSVAWRREDLAKRVKKTQDILAGVEKPKVSETGEVGVLQMVALCGLAPYVTNVNVPNMGQIANLPKGAIVETNAYFTGNKVIPLVAGEIPAEVQSLIYRHVVNQNNVVKYTLEGDYEGVFQAFVNDPNVCLPLEKARELFDKMLFNTKKYLPDYEKYIQSERY